MTRLLPALFLAVALVGCDATTPSDPAAASATEWTDLTSIRAVVLIGVVEAVDGRWRTVGGVKVATGRGTRIVDAAGLVVSADAVGLGAVVEIRGRKRADGTVRADAIQLWSPTGGDSKALEGRIEVLRAKTLVVDGTVFETDTLTRWLDSDGSELSSQDFRVGQHVAAAGHVRDGVLHADIVKLDR